MTKYRYVPPGVDPTLNEWPLEAPNYRGCLTFILGFAAAGLIGGTIYWNANRTALASKPPVTATVAATRNTYDDNTRTWTPSPTNTPLPTSTGTVTPVPPSETPAATASLMVFYSGPENDVRPVSMSTVFPPDVLPSRTPRPYTPPPTRVRPVVGSGGGEPAQPQPPVNPSGSVSGPVAPPRIIVVTFWAPPSGGRVTVHGVPMATAEPTVQPTGTQPTPAETFVPLPGPSTTPTLSGQTPTETLVPSETAWAPLPEQTATMAATP